MKLIALSIFSGSLVIAAAIYVTGRRPQEPHSATAALMAEDLHVSRAPLTRAEVEAVISNPANQKLIGEYFASKRDFKIDPSKPLSIHGSEDEKWLAVGYDAKFSDGSRGEVELGFTRDDFGRYKADTEPPLFLRPKP